MIKQDMDLNSNNGVLSHAKLNLYGGDEPLSSPEMGLLKLTSPELAFQSNSLVPSADTSRYFVYPKVSNDDQEYADGLGSALETLHMPYTLGNCAKLNFEFSRSSDHQSVHSGPPDYASINRCSNGLLGTPLHYSGETTSYQHHLPPSTDQQYPNFASSRSYVPKEESQIVPEITSFQESPPLSPIDMDTQEKIKAERKKLRNRIAASKCRKRKLERISRLEEKVKTLKCQNFDLASTASLLREQVAQLKQKVMSHVNSGCQLLPSHEHGQ